MSEYKAVEFTNLEKELVAKGIATVIQMIKDQPNSKEAENVWAYRTICPVYFQTRLMGSYDKVASWIKVIDNQLFVYFGYNPYRTVDQIPNAVTLLFHIMADIEYSKKEGE